MDLGIPGKLEAYNMAGASNVSRNETSLTNGADFTNDAMFDWS